MEILLRKSSQLIDNETNNRAECFMNILARFTEGKRLNSIQRGSFQARCHLSALRYNKSFDWHTSPWKYLMKNSPPPYLKEYVTKNLKYATAKRISKQTRRKNKVSLRNIDYGPRAIQPEPNDDEVLEESKNK